MAKGGGQEHKPPQILVAVSATKNIAIIDILLGLFLLQLDLTRVGQSTALETIVGSFGPPTRPIKICFPSQLCNHETSGFCQTGLDLGPTLLRVYHGPGGTDI